MRMHTPTRQPFKDSIPEVAKDFFDPDETEQEAKARLEMKAVVRDPVLEEEKRFDTLFAVAGGMDDGEDGGSDDGGGGGDDDDDDESDESEEEEEDDSNYSDDYYD